MPNTEQKAREAESRCRTCGGRVEADASSYPFCSARCRMADLGKWFDGAYRISREIKDSDIETVD
ncbi:MAG: DNA gyrase inhibitor YacG [Phycisphaerales bacterium]|nr:DNA gyrase inhibitor YacG [Phycisphaerales bacterium]